MGWRLLFGVLAVFLLGLVTASRDSSAESTDSSSTEDFPRVYHGRVSEDARPGAVVEFEPNNPILARDKSQFKGDKRVCGYTIYKKHSELPFRVDLVNNQTGAARVVLKDGYKLDYERRHKYKFEIAPHDCVTGKHANREEVHIQVLDVNEFGPTVAQDTYLVEVPEGKLVDEILRLTATDRDGSDDYSSICHYHIWTEDVPFRIDSDGVLYNTEPLDYSRRHNFILDVVVQDCGGRFSNKIIVNIKVVEACKAGWRGLAERIEYTPGSAQKLLGPQATLEKCDSTCSETQVSTRISLTTKHIGKGCDRDTYSIQSQRKLCGASSGSVDLLPSPALSKWTDHLPTDDGQEQDQIFFFDGRSTAIEIPSTKLNHSLDQHFTVSAWMKHEQNVDDDTKKGMKEHIMCNADGENMNRHHYSLFIHNCRLVFLLRQEPSGQDLNIFKPAEWRWKVPQVCDNQWHHYAVSVDFPQVRLYIDGKLFVNAKNNPEVIDDWPLHPSRKIHFTKLMVGACWQGGQQQRSQYFKGYLAGLSILRGKTESDRVIRCLNDCKEKLDFHAMSEMETGMSVAFNSEMTEITINGRNKSEVEHLVQRVGYINTRTFPTPGHRNIKVETDVKCAGGRQLTIPALNSMILVTAAEKPIITISGTENVARAEFNYTRGVKIFQTVQILSQTRQEAEEIDDDVANMLYRDVSSSNNRLDYCIIRADPTPLSLDDEHLKVPGNLLDDLGLEYTDGADGLIIKGADVVANYEEVLRSVQYVHRRPENLNSRVFTLTCSELNGRFVSNAFRVHLDVIHTVKHAQVPQAHAQENSIFQPQGDKVPIRLDQNMGSSSVYKPGRTVPGKSYYPAFIEMFGVHKTTPNSHSPLHKDLGVTLIVVVCVGFLLFMIVLGVVRIRAAHQRSQVVTVDGERPEMEWDNSALTITVNPMEQEEPYCGGAEVSELNASDSESDDDEDDEPHYDQPDDSSEEEPCEKPTTRGVDSQLEWDDSNLTV